MTRRPARHFSLDTPTAIRLLEAVPKLAVCYECDDANSMRSEPICNAAAVLRCFQHPMQDPLYPCWRIDGDTRTLLSITILPRVCLENKFDDEPNHFCVLLGYQFEDSNEHIPNLQSTYIRNRRRLEEAEPEDDIDASSKSVSLNERER